MSIIDEPTANLVVSLDSPEVEARLDAIVGKTDQPRQIAAPAQSYSRGTEQTRVEQAHEAHFGNVAGQQGIAARPLPVQQAAPVFLTNAQVPRANATSVSEPAKPRGRPRKSDAPQQQASPQPVPRPFLGGQDAGPDDPTDLPAFLQRENGGEQPSRQDMPFNTSTKPAFGIVQSAAVPDSALKSAIDQAFGLEIRR